MAEYICTACGYEGPGRKTKRGSGKAEFWIWSLLLIPGPIYSVWRRAGLKRQCTHCGLPAVVKVSSDAGFIAKRKVDIELGVYQPPKPVETQTTAAFGNESAAKMEHKKPANPDQW